MQEGMAMSGAPSKHLKLWARGSEIFVEIPGIAGRAPYITSYPCDTRGIAFVLSLIGAHRIDDDYAALPLDTYHSNLISKGPGSPEQQAAADRTLRQAGLLKP
jgi:hypothetical protein